MTRHDRWDVIKDLVQQALNRERDADAFLVEACGDDLELLEEARGLVRLHGDIDSFLETPAHLDGAALELPEVPGVRLEGLLGMGGMGIVYRAEQDSPRRPVAVKLMRQGLADERLTRRFLLEADVLGRLEHPNIARIYEAGALDGPERQPYIVMELIDGEPLDAWLAGRDVPVSDRIRLVADLADGVQHAHRKGVIHRDLKPGNVLVDGNGTPHILDFGVARLAGLDDIATLRTRAGQVIGTIPYMSPEQIGGDPCDLDTRTDVYSLGVILFEALTGALPLDLRGKALAEAARAVRDDDPVSITTLDRGYRGDLATIVEKALMKEKERRYGSAADLASDIRRFLAHEPILARPSSAIYNLTRFARRNRALVAGLIMFVLALTAGLVATTWQWKRADRAGQLEHRRYREAEAARALEQQAREEAEREARRAADLLAFYRRMIGAAAPRETLGENLTVVEALRVAALDVSTFEDVRTRVTLHRAIAAAFRELSQFDEAQRHVESALGLFHDHLDEETEPLSLARLRMEKAGVVLRLGRHEEALTLARAALAMLEERAGDGEVADGHVRVAEALGQAGDYAAAESHLLEAERLEHGLSGGLSERSVQIISVLAALDEKRSRLDAAERRHRRVLEIVDSTAASPLHVATAEENLGRLAVLRGQWADAVTLLERVIERRAPIFGEDHEIVVGTRVSLAAALAGCRRDDDAVAMCEDAIDDLEAVDPEHPLLGTAWGTLAGAYAQLGRLGDALDASEESLDAKITRLGPAHDEVLEERLNRAAILRRARGPEAARAELETGRKALAERGDASGLMGARLMGQLAVLDMLAGKLDEAEKNFTLAVETCARHHGRPHTSTAYYAYGLASVALRREKHDEAIRLFRRCRDIYAGVPVPETDQGYVFTEFSIAKCMFLAGRRDEARPALESARASLLASVGADHARTSEVDAMLATYD